jgi:hypothetical protein
LTCRCWGGRRRRPARCVAWWKWSLRDGE